jgi:hypothetical protein
MRRHLLNGLLAAVALAATLASMPLQAQQDAPHRRQHAHWHSKPGAVMALRLLREGGNVLVVRHAKTDMLAKDARGGDFADCSWQRNLSPMGREASREMGDAVRLLGIPVGEVSSSPYCRCMDTARLAFGRADAVVALAPSSGPGQGMREAGAALSAILAKGARVERTSSWWRTSSTPRARSARSRRKGKPSSCDRTPKACPASRRASR